MNNIYNTYRPEGFGTISSYLMVEHPAELIAFLKNAFFAEELSRSINPQNGELANVILKIGTSCFMVSQARNQYLNMRTSFYLYVDDVDEMHKRAVEFGAQVEFEPPICPTKTDNRELLILAAIIGGFQND